MANINILSLFFFSLQVSQAFLVLLALWVSLLKIELVAFLETKVQLAQMALEVLVKQCLNNRIAKVD